MREQASPGRYHTTASNEKIESDERNTEEERLLKDWFDNSMEHEGFEGFEEEPSGEQVQPRKKMTWSKEINKVIMKCYIQSEPERRGFRKRMLR